MFLVLQIFPFPTIDLSGFLLWPTSTVDQKWGHETSTHDDSRQNARRNCPKPFENCYPEHQVQFLVASWSGQACICLALNKFLKEIVVWTHQWMLSVVPRFHLRCRAPSPDWCRKTWRRMVTQVWDYQHNPRQFCVFLQRIDWLYTDIRARFMSLVCEIYQAVPVSDCVFLTYFIAVVGNLESGLGRTFYMNGENFATGGWNKHSIRNTTSAEKVSGVHKKSATV